MPLPYRKVKDMYDTLHDAGVVTQTLPEWSQEQNKLSESDLYSAGLHDNLIKRASVGIDRLLESTGLPTLTKEFGGEYGSLFGDRAAGERIGQGLPRMGTNMASFLIPGAGWANVARLGIAGLMSGAETYTETGSPAAGALSGATVAALPGITGAAEKAVASRGVGALGQFLTGQGAAAGVMETSAFGQDVIQGQPLHNPLSVDTLLNLTLGQTPFTALHLAGKVIGRIAPSTDTMQHAIDKTEELRALKEAKGNATETPFVPEPATPEVLKETQARLAKLRGEQVSIADDPTIPADQKLERVNELLQQEQETLKQHVPASNSVFGDSITEESPRQQVVGRELKSNDKWRAIEVADLPVNPEELRGKVVTYSRAYEPNPQIRSTGDVVFGLPDPQWRTIKTQEEWQGRFAKKSDGTPELPIQTTPASEEQYYSHIQDLKKVETEASTAQTPADLQKAVVRLQGVQHENDIPPTNDATIKKTVAQLTKLGSDPTTVVQTAVKVETKRTERKLTATREKERAVPPLTPEEAAKVSAQMGEGGFSVITADKLSHKNTDEVAVLPKDESANPFHNIVEEAAYTVTNADVKTKPEDVGLFRTLVGEFGTLKDLSPTDIEDVAQLIADRDGVTLAESKDEIKHFLTQPHVTEWSQKLEEQVAKVREDNAGPGGMRPPPGERLVTVRRADGSTYQASFGNKYWEGGRASIAKLTADGKWSHGILGTDETIVETPEVNVTPHIIPFVPESPTDIKLVERLNLPEGGVGLHKFLLNDKSPLIRALGKDLQPYQEALGRIDVIIGETKSGMATATDTGNGRTQVVIPPASLDSPILGFTVAHELVHGLTISELNNPTKADLVNQFDSIRERLIKALPKDQQARLKQLELSDWRSKYAAGIIGFDSIAPDATAYEKTILYSLVNTKEMVAQGLSSQQMQRFMRSVKGDKTGSWFNKFTNTVKELLGFKTDDSIFNEFLSRTNQLIEHGDYLASFREFSERYYENLGVSQSVGLGNTRRALGVILDTGFGTTKEDILNRLGNDVGVRSAELYSAKRDITNMITEGGDSFKDMGMIMAELGFESTVKGADDFVQDVLHGEISNYHDALDMLPGEVSKYVFAKVRDMNDVLGVLKAATNEGNKGLINLADPAALRGPVKDAIKALERVAEVQQVHELGRQLVESSMALEPDTFAAHMDAAPDVKTLEDFGNDDVRKPGSVSKFFVQASRMARRFPVTAELIDRVYELGPNAANMKGNILKVFGVDLKAGQQAITKDGLAESVRSISTPRTLNAVNRWMYWNNEVARKEDRGVTMLPDNHPEVAKLLQGLSTTERDAVIDTVTKQSVSTQIGHAELLEKMHKTGVTMGANIVMADRGMKTQESIAVADQLFNALRADRTNPQIAQQADAEIAVVQSKMTPEGFLELLKYTQAETEKFGLWKNYFKENPAWATAQRLERFLVSFTRGKEKKQLQASSVKEANVISEGGKNVEIVDQWKGADDYFPSTDFGPILDRVSELEQNQLRSLKSKGYLDEQGAGDFERMSIASQLARENAAGQAGVPKFQAPPRRLSQGADELPWFWNHVAHAERVSNFWSRKLLRAQSTLHLNDPDLKAVPELQAWAKQHVENVLQPDPAITQRINRFVSTWFMGFAPASAMMNGFQTITTAVAEMTNVNGGRVLDSYSKWGRAVAEVSKESLPGGKWSNEDYKWLSKQMSEAHEWDFSMYSDEAATQDAASTNFKRVMMKQKPQTIGQKLSTLSGTYSNVGMWMFKSVERFNNKVASVMAFDHYMSEGMTREDALVEAKRFNRSVNYSGGRANRPVGAFDNAGSASRSVAMLATNMQGYNLGVVGQIADYLQRGFFRPAGITPAETYAARKAGLQMMATQMVAAGALGLPFASGVVALLNTLFPDLEINRHIIEWTKSFFDGDKQNGNVLGDIALTGLPSMVGWDMQSRLSMGNIVPGVTEYNGFQPEALLGPPANLVAGFVNGAMRVAGGDAKGGYSFVPPGVRKLFQLVANEGKINDYKDRPLFTPTVGEQAGIALGFQPKRLTDFNTAGRIAEQNKIVSTRREGQFHQQQAEQVLAGNFGTVRQTLLERQLKEKDYNARDAVRSISQSAEELTFPRDLRREGTRSTGAERNRLLSTFNLAPSEPSEVDRLNFRQGIQQRLGLPPPRGFQELRAAQLMDQLRKDNPQATRSELRQMVEQTLHVNRQSSSLLPE